MEITKRNGNVCFSEETHTYWNENDNKKYISVTTLIGKYVTPFDKDFWSAYKALEKLIPSDYWKLEKQALLNTKKINPELLERHNITQNDLNKVQQDILDEWQKKNIESCERGTKMHLEIENSFYAGGKNVTLKKFGIGGKFECKKNYVELDLPKGVYPEYLVSVIDDNLRLAGQIDLLIKDNNDISLIDHKSCIKIDKSSGYNPVLKTKTKMLYPLNNLQDCNFYHYSLQLSTYAWMLQKINPEFCIKNLILNHYDHEGHNYLHYCDYLKDDVERMIKHYKKSLILKEQKNKRKRIEY